MAESLQAQFKEAVANCQWQEAQEIKRQMDKDQDTRNKTTIATYKKSFQDLADDCKQQFENDSLELREAIGNQEMLIRKRVSDIFRELQIRHIEVLVEFEKEYLLKFARDRVRPVANAVVMREQAKLAAMNKDFARAEDLKHQAELCQEQEDQRREEFIRTTYLDGRRKIMDKQRDDFRELDAQLRQSVDDLHKREQYELEKVEQRYKKGILDAYRQTLLFLKQSVRDIKLQKECIRKCSKLYGKVVKGLSKDE